MPRARSTSVLHGLSIALIALSTTGCVERVLVVDSAPPGARVFVDGRDRGTTPLRLPYVHDGTFRVRLEMEGYESVSDEVVTPTRADAVPGIDFFAENVWPGRIARSTVRRYEMARLKTSSYTDAEIEALLRKADAFRERTRREVAEPGSPAPTRPTTPAPAPAPPPAPRAPPSR